MRNGGEWARYALCSRLLVVPGTGALRRYEVSSVVSGIRSGQFVQSETMGSIFSAVAKPSPTGHRPDLSGGPDLLYLRVE